MFLFEILARGSIAFHILALPVVALIAGIAAVFFLGQWERSKIEAEQTRRLGWYHEAVRGRRYHLEQEHRSTVEDRRQRLRRRFTAGKWAIDRTNGRPESGGPDPLNSIDVTEVVGAAGLSTAELLWSWARMDPDVIHAAKFSLVGVDGGLDFVRTISGHYDHLGGAAKQASFNRLLGYVGERHYDVLVSHSHVVTSAATANQPMWDFVVDGHLVNIKTVADVSPLHAVAIAHPNITYAVPQDAAGHLTHNMVRVPGLSHHDLVAGLHHAIDSVNGDVAFHALAHHLPVIAIGRAALKGYAQVRAGQQAKVAVRYAANGRRGHARTANRC